MDEARVQSDAEILFMGSMENGDADGAKTKPRPDHLAGRRSERGC
jgi:hypothetical protein